MIPHSPFLPPPMEESKNGKVLNWVGKIVTVVTSRGNYFLGITGTLRLQTKDSDIATTNREYLLFKIHNDSSTVEFRFDDIHYIGDDNKWLICLK